MLRQTEWGAQNGPITKIAVLLSNYFIFWKFCFSIRTCHSWFEVPTTQMTLFILFVITWVWFEGAFSLWASLKLILLLPLETILIRMCHISWEQFCCSCMYTKTVRADHSYLKKLLWVTDLPVSAMICRLDFPCFVGIYLCAFSTFPGWLFFGKTIGLTRR